MPRLAGSPAKRYDVCVVGAGVLGTCLAFWLSELFDLSIALVEMEGAAATHASARNTGVVHRPFYMNPEKKGRFAKVANRSYGMWEALATRYSLPWRRVGILEVATDDASLKTLDDYSRWAATNGMADDEVEVLDPEQASEVEPLVKCTGAFVSKADAVVDYRILTECVLALARDNGVSFLAGRKLARAVRSGGTTSLDLLTQGERSVLECSLLINAAGGGALRLAHSMGLAKGMSELHFRGDYWEVADPDVASRFSHCVYSVPRRTEYPFLDPHLVLRASGKVEIGPNAALVAGPYVYDGFTGGASQLASAIFERPMAPRLRLAVDSEFISLVREEWRRSISKRAMCDRVREFVPSLDHGMLGRRGVGGVRNSLIDGKGFVPEAVEESTDASLHILNYNSPGATGAPAYSALLVASLVEKGLLGSRRRKETPHGSLWRFEGAAGTA